MRMVYNVIESILNAIPEDEKVNYAAMVDKMQDLAYSSRYKAPELMPEQFQLLSNLLNNYLGEPDTDWKRKVQRIFANDV